MFTYLTYLKTGSHSTLLSHLGRYWTSGKSVVYSFCMHDMKWYISLNAVQILYILRFDHSVSVIKYCSLFLWEYRRFQLCLYGSIFGYMQIAIRKFITKYIFCFVIIYLLTMNRMEGTYTVIWCFFDRASWYRIISSTSFNAQFSLFINNMFVTLLSSTCFEQ